MGSAKERPGSRSPTEGLFVEPAESVTDSRPRGMVAIDLHRCCEELHAAAGLVWEQGCGDDARACWDAAAILEWWAVGEG